jgi:hypothetical protein
MQHEVDGGVLDASLSRQRPLDKDWHAAHVMPVTGKLTFSKVPAESASLPIAASTVMVFDIFRLLR